MDELMRLAAAVQRVQREATARGDLEFAGRVDALLLDKRCDVHWLHQAQNLVAERDIFFNAQGTETEVA